MLTDTVHLRRLAWAGVEARLGDVRVLIDPLEHAQPLAAVLGAPRTPLPPVETGPGTHALITHTHPDHYDHELIARLTKTGNVHCHAPVAHELRQAGIEPVAQELGQSRSIGPFTVTPVPSLDWRGSDSDQVAWIVQGAGTRIIHCGDTQWHGDWWRIAREHGPFDIAFVPVNGVIAQFEGYAANVPVTMTPEQAVEAAAALGAPAVCAIHYELFDNPPIYTQQQDIEARFRKAAHARGITALLPADGAVVPLQGAAS